jgi:4-diphosphocytidyl-2-C-methyl-D-erythritol kinase
LGGGSSNAATVLVALNELWEVGLSIDQLAELGLTLGADVPVFVRGHSAWAEGVGERLTALELPVREYVILHPFVGIATQALFQAPELTRNCAQATMSGYLSGIETQNVFTPLVRARYPEVAAALDWLGRYGEARLSGTGSCVFAAVESAQAAEAIVAACPPEFAAYSASGVNRSPLLDVLDVYRAQRGKS